MYREFPRDVRGFEPSAFGLIQPRLPTYAGSLVPAPFLEEQLIRWSGGVELVEDAAGFLEVADLGNGYAYVCDGTNLTQKVPGGPDVVYAEAGISTICEHLGRLYMSGDFSQLNSMVLDTGDGTGIPALDNSYVYWTSAGYEDMQAVLEGDAAVFSELLEQNDLGWIHVSNVGDVVQLLPRGDSVVVYGTEGIAILKQGAVTNLVGIAAIGLANRGAVVDAGGQHRFLSMQGILYEFGEAITRLDYQHVFNPLLTDDFILTFDPSTGNMFLASVDSGYLYNANGLAEIATRISSIVVEDGVSKRTSRTATSFDQMVWISDLDLGSRELKTLRGFKVLHILDTGGEIEASVLRRNTKATAFVAVTIPDMLGNGYQQVGTTAIEFSLQFTGSGIEILSDVVLEIEEGESFYTGAL